MFKNIITAHYLSSQARTSCRLLLDLGKKYSWISATDLSLVSGTKMRITMKPMKLTLPYSQKMPSALISLVSSKYECDVMKDKRQVKAMERLLVTDRTCWGKISATKKCFHTLKYHRESLLTQLDPTCNPDHGSVPKVKEKDVLHQ